MDSPPSVGYGSSGHPPSGHAPSGLFPSGPPRPTFREPHPIRPSALFAGASVAVAWLLVFGLLATSASGYVWLTLVTSMVAMVAAIVLVRVGDRGAAVGVALATALGLAVASAVVIERWATSGWPLW